MCTSDTSSLPVHASKEQPWSQIFTGGAVLGPATHCSPTREPTTRLRSPQTHGMPAPSAAHHQTLSQELPN